MHSFFRANPSRYIQVPPDSHIHAKSHVLALVPSLSPIQDIIPLSSKNYAIKDRQGGVRDKTKTKKIQIARCSNAANAMRLVELYV